ncbi:MAG TPA: M20 family metallopeptidase [Ktedonobacterales bacterium]|nr:M20 family metallopeptidase [Ktedonobacterales bacterium]
MEISSIVAAAERRVDSFLDDLRTLVNIDSGTYTPAGVQQVAALLGLRFEESGCTVEILPTQHKGPNLIARMHGEGDGRVLIVGHMDTVFPDGEAQRRPFRIEGRRAFGPGVFDMKSGLLVGLNALRVLHELGQMPLQQVTFLCNSDEEVGSPESHDLVAALAREADAVLVLEPTSDLGRVTVSRKGVGMYAMELKGVSAHAGVEPRRGRSAILELAHRVVALHALNGTIPGVTVNVGVVTGGERPNVVADRARAEIDIRVPDEESMRAIQAELTRVASERVVPDVEITLDGRFEHLPFVQSEQSKRLFDKAQEVAAELGVPLRGEPTGGGSDGNTSAALGIPTLDGLGLVGGLAHNPGEFVDLDSLVPRIVLLAGLLTRLGEDA